MLFNVLYIARNTGPALMSEIVKDRLNHQQSPLLPIADLLTQPTIDSQPALMPVACMV
jgi:hypothetical protein